MDSDSMHSIGSDSFYTMDSDSIHIRDSGLKPYILDCLSCEVIAKIADELAPVDLTNFMSTCQTVDNICFSY